MSQILHGTHITVSVYPIQYLEHNSRVSHCLAKAEINLPHTLITGHHWLTSLKMNISHNTYVHLCLSHWTMSDLQTWACLLMYP